MVQNLDQLEILDVCDELEEIIEGGESLPDSLFPNLLSLEPYELPKLRSIKLSHSGLAFLETFLCISMSKFEAS